MPLRHGDHNTGIIGSVRSERALKLFGLLAGPKNRNYF